MADIEQNKIKKRKSNTEKIPSVENKRRVELLSPAGNMEKFYTAIHFGADAVYLSGKQYGLRAFSDNFEIDEIAYCCDYAHKLGRKVYVTINIFANNGDFDTLGDYIISLKKAKVDAIIVSDAGVINFVKSLNIDMPIHLSTQASTTNKYAVDFWRKTGINRIVMARELSLADISEIIKHNPDTEIECFVHGAMCISYSGRCLISNFLTSRNSNRGECVQACRWNWTITESGRSMDVEQDQRGTYFLNSKDLSMLRFIPSLIESGIASFKIEGRMKSPYYVACVTNAYRRMIDAYYNNTLTEELTNKLDNELYKASHRNYTTGFYFDTDEIRQCYETSKADSDVDFVAVVTDYNNLTVTVEMRNRFRTGEKLEVLSSGESFNKIIEVGQMTADNQIITDAKLVQQQVSFCCSLKLKKGDMLRTIRSNENNA